MQLQTWRALGTDWLLDQWGRWARVPDETRIGWPSAANFVKFMGGSIKTPEIDLDVALEVDRAVKMSSLSLRQTAKPTVPGAFTTRQQTGSSGNPTPGGSLGGRVFTQRF